MVGKTVLERKIDWWFRRIDKVMTITDFELVKMSDFDENGMLIFREKIKFHDIIKLVKRVSKDEEIPDFKDFRERKKL